MQIELQKIINANTALAAELTAFNELEADRMAKQATVDEAAAKSDAAKKKLMGSIASVEQMLADILIRNQAENAVPDVESKNPITG